MYQYQPKRKNKIASVLLIVLAVVAIALFSLSVTLSAYTGLLQLGSVVCFCLMVLFFTRYFARSYVYRIIRYDGDAAPDLVIGELSRGESVVVCRFSLDGLVSVEKDSRSARKGLGKHYNYCVDIAPDDAYILRFEECGERASVIISPDKNMLVLLEKHLKSNLESNEKEA